MSVSVVVSVDGPARGLPARADLRRWVAAAVGGRRARAELGIRVVGEHESRELNRSYRGKDAPTNVLAFPAGLPAELRVPLLGDLVICREVVAREAVEQGKDEEAHWAHMVVHGTLHLLGYDHCDEATAGAMEAAEVQILAGLGYPDPYAWTAAAARGPRGGPAAGT